MKLPIRTLWLQNLISIQGAKQLSNYLAVYFSLRRAMDDWVRIKNFKQFKTLIESVGLVCLVDSCFESSDELKLAYGLQSAPTTHAIGKPFREEMLEQENDNLSLHVIVSKRQEWAIEALSFAWYPLVVHGRVIQKPQSEHKKLGDAFGYPDCCIKFFMSHNSWGISNSIIDALKFSKTTPWLCNCLYRYTQWMLNYHAPCAFDCPKSIDLATELFNEISMLEPEYSFLLREKLESPILFFNEHISFGFNQYELEPNNSIRYKEIYPIINSGAGIDNRMKNIIKQLQSVNRLNISENLLKLYYDNNLCGYLHPVCNEDLIELPSLIQFNDR